MDGFSETCIIEKEWSKNTAGNRKGVTLMMDQGMSTGLESNIAIWSQWTMENG